MMASPRHDPGSFRDRDGRVFYLNGDVYRALSERALEDWACLRDSDFFEQASAEGKLVSTAEVELDSEVAQGLSGSWAAFLRHEAVPFVSYPYEWTFSMLRDAALLQLELIEGALRHGLDLKDASAYNVQWIGSRPVFIDIASFQRRAEGDPWVGYLQFCQLFLYPLLLLAYRGIDFRPWLRGSIDGIEPSDMDRLLRGRDRLRRGVLTHVVLQAKLQARARNSTQSLRRDLQRAGFKKELILANLRRLCRLVSRLRWRASESEWSGYTRETSYSHPERDQKAEFVSSCAGSRRWTLAWDLGCNTGAFSRLVSPYCDYVVAMDGDPLVVDRLYQELRGENEQRILPLAMDLAQASPGLGWRGQERRALDDRTSPQLVLALALLHHLVISANVPLAEVVDWLASLGAALIIEFVSKDDPMVQRLLLNKEDRYADYERPLFERFIEPHFTVEQSLALEGGSRFLYFLTPR